MTAEAGKSPTFAAMSESAWRLTGGLKPINEGSCPSCNSSCPLPRWQRRYGCRAQSFGHFHQIGDRIRLHLFHDFSAVGFDRDFTDAQFGTDLFVQSGRKLPGP